MPKNLIRVCCVCRKSEHEGDWNHHEHHKEDIEKNGKATHTFCPPCADEQHKKINDFVKGKVL